MPMRDRHRVSKGSCLDCTGDVSGWLGKLPGVEDVRVQTTAGVVVIEHDGRVSTLTTASACCTRAESTRSTPPHPG